MARLFTFGCSYSSYCWPTYANLLSLEYDNKGDGNWAMSGLGNRAIAERLAEAHAKHRFTKDDTIIVQWSSHIRHDWWHQTSLPDRMVGWKTYGSIFNYHNVKLFDKNWVDTFFFEPAYMMHTFNHIMLVQNMLDSIGCTWYMTSIGDIRNMGNDLRQHNDKYGELTQLVKNVDAPGYTVYSITPELEIYNKPIWEDHADHWMMPMELFAQTCSELTYSFRDSHGNPWFDLHPTTRQQTMWIEQELTKHLPISQRVIDAGYEIANYTDAVHRKYITNFDAFQFALAKKEKFPKIVEEMNWPGLPQGF